MLAPRCEIIICVDFYAEFNCAFSYWPLAHWPKKSVKSWSIIGYPDKKHKSNPKKRTINISTDLWGNVPQELDKLLDIFDDF